MTQEQAAQLASEIQEAMGNGYCTSLTLFGEEEKEFIMGLWTRRNPELPWLSSQIDRQITVFDSVEKWGLFKQAALVLAQNEQEKQMEETIEEMAQALDRA